MFGFKKNDEKCCDIWDKFKAISEHHNLIGLNDNTRRAYRFYEGDQWYEVNTSGRNLAVYNFIAPIVRYKTAMVAMHNMAINYSVLGERDARYSSVTKEFNKRAARQWERMKLDSKCWKVIRSAMIAGESYLYFFNGAESCQVIENTDVFLADEQQPDIQKQPYIIIAERRSVNDVIEEAKKNKISKDLISMIRADNDTENSVTTENSYKEVDSAGGKCTCLTYLELKPNGDLIYSRCTKYVVYKPAETICEYGCYPIASLIVNPKKGTARGRGEVQPLIKNQIEVNRGLVRRLINAELTAYSRLVYSSERIVNPSALGEVGTAIEIENGSVEDVRKYINYLTPAPTSSDAANLTNELMNVTRDLAGAGDAALGNIDPTQASGTAIIAVRDQAAIPLNEQTAAFRQFVEDIARIWFNSWRVYEPEGIHTDDGVITPDELKKLDLIVRIDASSVSPFSMYAREQALERLFLNGHVSFEEYISALDDNSSVPKAALESIINKRAAAAQAQADQFAAQQLASLPGTMPELEAEVAAAREKYISADDAMLEDMAHQAAMIYGGDA